MNAIRRFRNASDENVLLQSCSCS